VAVGWVVGTVGPIRLVPSTGDAVGRTLAWGRRYLMVRPDFYRIEYAINPYMRLDDQPDPAAALDEWEAVRAAIEAAGATVDVMDAHPDQPDMVYAMNLGFAHSGDKVAMSRMRYPQRRGETPMARARFEEAGLVPSPGQGGAHFEAGDAFVFGDSVICGYGPRTDKAGLEVLAADLDVRVRGFEIVHPGMYHLDLAFCPIDEERALVYADAFEPHDLWELLKLIPDPILLTGTEAAAFTANTVVVGRTLVMPHCPERLRPWLELHGFEVVVVPTPQFIKGGGSIRCLTSPIDVTLDGAHSGAEVITVPRGQR
jgi:N-dimethylarginine dimethylaminohydrolase